MIKYRLMKMAKQHPYVKLSLDVMVEPLDGETRLPTKEELAEVAKQLQGRRGRHYNLMFVCFYLPDMVINTGAFATAHYRAGRAEEVRIMPFHVPKKWQHLLGSDKEPTEDHVGWDGFAPPSSTMPLGSRAIQTNKERNDE